MLQRAPCLHYINPSICGLAICPVAASVSARRAPSKETFFFGTLVFKTLGQSSIGRRSSTSVVRRRRRCSVKRGSTQGALLLKWVVGRLRLGVFRSGGSSPDFRKNFHSPCIISDFAQWPLEEATAENFHSQCMDTRFSLSVASVASRMFFRSGGQIATIRGIREVPLEEGTSQNFNSGQLGNNCGIRAVLQCSLEGKTAENFRSPRTDTRFSSSVGGCRSSVVGMLSVGNLFFPWFLARLAETQLRGKLPNRISRGRYSAGAGLPAAL